MQIVHDDSHLQRAMAELASFGSLGKEGGLSAERPVLVDRFLEDATEVDVDAIRDHTGEVMIGGRVLERLQMFYSGEQAIFEAPFFVPLPKDAPDGITLRVVAAAVPLTRR
jgi:carbamoyl-phosphate synthase large subunit